MVSSCYAQGTGQPLVTSWGGDWVEVSPSIVLNNDFVYNLKNNQNDSLTNHSNKTSFFVFFG